MAPDFVLVQRGIRDAFVDALKRAVTQFFGPDPQRSTDYGRIINSRHLARLVGYLDDGRVLLGGEHDANARYLAPTLLGDVAPGARVMQEEIFGPILPVIDYDTLDEALASLRDRPTPLAAYVFSRSPTVQQRVLSEVRSGGACVNDVVSHMIGLGMPFGGLGASGMGAYHGKSGFDAFSHPRTVLRRATWLDLPFRYPPAGLPLKTLKRGFRWLMGD